MIERKKGENLLIAALLAAVAGILAFAPIWLRNSGMYVEYGDYITQYVPFIKELKRMAASGSFAWSWNTFLGDNFIGVYSYYTVFNPFAWLVAAFPEERILYGTMFATILKIVISVLTSMLYMRRFCKSDIFALTGALLYTFSGYTVINTYFYFFLDVIAVFPLLMYGLELLITERKRGVYQFALLMNAAINYYLFVCTVFIVVIYVVCRLELYKPASWKNCGRIFVDIALSSIIGTGMATVVLLPSVRAVIGSGKAVETVGTAVSGVYSLQTVLERLRTLVAPVESCSYHVFYNADVWNSCGVYLPAVGVIFVIYWCLRKKDWIRSLCVFLLVCYFVPVLNAAFSLFSSESYTRWLYGMALVFSLVTVLALEEMMQTGKRIKFGYVASYLAVASLLLLVPTGVYLLQRYGQRDLRPLADFCLSPRFMGYSELAVMLVVSAINFIALLLILNSRRKQHVLWIVVMACVLNYAAFNEINYDVHPSVYSNAYYQEKTLVDGYENPELTYSYRIDHPKPIMNYSLARNMPSANSFHSLQNPKGLRFAEAVGIADSYVDTILLTPAAGGVYTNALLSVRYYYDYDGNIKVPQGMHFAAEENRVKIYENEFYIPIGYVYDTYATEALLAELPDQERARFMLQTLVISEENTELADRYLQQVTAVEMESDLAAVVAARRETSCSFFAGNSQGFEAQIDLPRDNIVFFSVPNDEGWEIAVNGEPAEVIDVHYGLMGVLCKEGSNRITAVYHTPWLDAGLACSVFFLLVWFVRSICLRQKKESVGVSRGCA